MKVSKIVLKKDIHIVSGTVIPKYTSNNSPIGYDLHFKKGSILIKNKTWSIQEIRRSKYYLTPYHPAIFEFILKIALEQGAKIENFDDGLNEFKMFENINGSEGRYICSFYADSVEKANIDAHNFIKEDSNFYRCNDVDYDFLFVIR